MARIPKESMYSFFFQQFRSHSDRAYCSAVQFSLFHSCVRSDTVNHGAALQSKFIHMLNPCCDFCWLLRAKICKRKEREAQRKAAGSMKTKSYSKGSDKSMRGSNPFVIGLDTTMNDSDTLLNVDGIMSVYATPSLVLASVSSSMFFGLWNLFAGQPLSPFFSFVL